MAEFEYSPTACKKTYRMLVVRKNIRVMKGQQFLFDKTEYLFYITNDWESSASDIVFTCNDRGDQEKLCEPNDNHRHNNHDFHCVYSVSCSAKSIVRSCVATTDCAKSALSPVSTTNTGRSGGSGSSAWTCRW